MAFIELVPTEPAAETEAIEDEARATTGYVPNYVRAFAARPEVYRAWQQLNGAIKAAGDLRRYELATLAAARRLRSSYCSLAHGRILAEQFFDSGAVRALPEGLDAADAAVMELAEKVAADATSVSPEDVERLRRLGLEDAEILDVVLTAAARCFFSKTLDALGVQADATYLELEPELRDALVVGRPIESV
jgi:uncharacterized peroxidase-related enzyme